MATDTTNAHAELQAAEKELEALRRRVVELRRKAGAQTVGDYTLKDPDGNPVQLSSLFGDRNDLIIIHNMGRGCRYCTLWADGFTGFLPHIEDRAAFAVVSPDEPSVMKAFAEGRGWTFRILSNHGGTFTRDVGFENDGKVSPGVSTFHRDPDGTIRRVGCAVFGPGDDFCAIWHIFDLLDNGPDGWEPQYSYAGA
ncbi:MAG: DUF899 family protein [Candidatus Zixiibacteriota bacterium]